jgi:hypothetical protein
VNAEKVYSENFPDGKGRGGGPQKSWWQIWKRG